MEAGRVPGIRRLVEESGGQRSVRSLGVACAVHAVGRLVDTIDRLTQTSATGVYPKQHLEDTLIEHRQSIDKHGGDPAEMRHWSPPSAGNLA